MDTLFDFIALLLWGFCAVLAMIFCVYLFRRWRLKRLNHPRWDYYRKKSVFRKRHKHRHKHRHHHHSESPVQEPDDNQ